MCKGAPTSNTRIYTLAKESAYQHIVREARGLKDTF